MLSYLIQVDDAELSMYASQLAAASPPPTSLAGGKAVDRYYKVSSIVNPLNV